MRWKSQKKNKQKQKGSFLLELLIAFAIISTALTIVVDSFITSQRSYRTTVEQAELTRMLTRILEDMTVEARVSENFTCGGTPNCTGGTVFEMEHIEGLNNQAAGEIVSYRLNSNAIEKQNPGAGSYLPMTPPNIVVEDFYVEVVGDHSTDDQIQALITITARDSDDATQQAHVQTSFTERRY